MEILENQVDETVLKISELSEIIKKKKIGIEHMRNELIRKEDQLRIIKLEKQTYEENNKLLREKLEQAERINRGESNVVKDFKIKELEVLNYVPTTPFEGIVDIENCLKQLKETVKAKQNKTNVKKNEMPFVCVKYQGQTIRYLIPDIAEYTFQDLMDDICEVFCLDSSRGFFFKDSNNCVWPLSPPVLDYLKRNSKELQLFLTRKTAQVKKSQADILEEKGKSQTVEDKIQKFFTNQNNYDKYHKNDCLETEDDMEHNKKLLMKLNRERETSLMIEKTFGPKIISFISYLIFVTFIIFFTIKKNAVTTPLMISQVIDKEFYSNEFMLNFSLYDFMTRDSNGETNNYSFYQVPVSLKEIQDATLLKPWLTEIYFQKLEFLVPNRSIFMQRHRLVGPIRFFQIRQEKSKNCTAISGTTSYEDIQKIYCFGAFSTPATEPNFPFMDYMGKKYKIFKEECENSNFTSSSACVIFKDGYSYRNVSMSYVYNGKESKYDLSAGYYFDLQPIYVNDKLSSSDLEKLSQYISFSWIDLATRLITITFNAYLNIDTDNTLISVTLYIEISSSQFLIKSFDIKTFKMFMNFELLIHYINDFGVLSGIWKIIQKYILEVYYILSILFVSIVTLMNQYQIIKEKKSAILYKGLFIFIFNVTIGCLNFGVLVMRITLLIFKYLTLKEHIQNNFSEFFSVNYFVPYDELVKSGEILMIFLLCINTMNAFYIEIIEKVLLIFKYSSKYFISLIIVYIFMVLAYAACCTIVYGWHISGK